MRLIPKRHIRHDEFERKLNRHDMAKEAYQAAGAELKERYMVMGQHDLGHHR